MESLEPRAETDTARVNILMVDDSPDKLLAMESVLDDLGQNLVKANSGEEALRLLLKGEYALILLDVNMPGLDGKKTLAIIKQDQNLKKIPVVILTTSSDEKDVTQCYELGASTYIQKPVDFEGLVEAVSRIKDYWFGVALLPKELQQ